MADPQISLQQQKQLQQEPTTDPLQLRQCPLGFVGIDACGPLDACFGHSFSRIVLLYARVNNIWLAAPHMSLSSWFMASYDLEQTTDPGVSFIDRPGDGFAMAAED